MSMTDSRTERSYLRVCLVLHVTWNWDHLTYKLILCHAFTLCVPRAKPWKIGSLCFYYCDVVTFSSSFDCLSPDYLFSGILCGCVLQLHCTSCNTPYSVTVEYSISSSLFPPAFFFLQVHFMWLFVVFFVHYLFITTLSKSVTWSLWKGFYTWHFFSCQTEESLTLGH